MKTNFQKIFIWLSLSLVFFLWTNFVNAQNHSNSNQCSSIPNHSNNSNDWISFATNTNITSRYINSENAFSLAVDWGSICSGAYIAWWSSPLILDWKKNLCSSNFASLKNYQESLFNAFKTAKSYNLNWWFNSHDAVWSLQNLMLEAKCHDKRDCKLWVNTISNFLFCNVCSAIDSSWKELNSLTPNKTCEDGYGFTENDLCCQPLECKEPTIKINWDESFEKYGSDSLHIDIDYSTSVAGTLSLGNINIEGWTMNGGQQAADNKITFALLPDENKNSITIKIADVKLNWVECPNVEKTIHRDIECQLTKDRQDCDNKNTFTITNNNFTGFKDLLEKECVKWGVEIPFCPDTCTTWLVWTSCEETYGSGWLSDWEESACCKNCWPNKKPAGTGCVCTTTSTDCKIPWDRLNPNTCKCECDPTQKCCGIQLNTVVPFIGDCIEMTTQNDTSSSNDPNTSTVNQLNAFPFLMMWLTKILVTVILIFSFLIVIAAGLMMTTWVYSETNYKKWMEWIKKIVVALILLWSSWLILKLINPSFFGG